MEAPDGINDGEFEGDCDGSYDGLVEGVSVGLPDGCVEDLSLGVLEGCKLGLDDDGFVEGWTVGQTLGN